MKIGIVMFQNMRYAPFLKMYEEILRSVPGVEYDVLYFDRDRSLQETKRRPYIALPWYGKGTLAAPKYEKALNFLLYARNAKRTIQKNRYDFLIVLTTFPAVLLSGFLTKRYPGRYLVDIRDYTQEHFGPYYRMESKVLAGAAMRAISSPGFVNFLPPAEYCVCHNFTMEESVTACPAFTKAAGEKVVISYIGSISYETQCKQLIDLVEKDDRFIFRFYGNEANGTEVSEYVRRVHNDRIQMMGAFSPGDRPAIYGASDLVFNCYGNESPLVKYAISNKYYDGAIYKKPLLVSPGTAMAEYAGPYAYALDLGKVRSLDGLWDWYWALDTEKFAQYAQQVIQTARQENELFCQKVRACLKTESR